MERRLIFTIFALGLIVLAVGGWTVQGVRWTLTGSRRARGGFAPA